MFPLTIAFQAFMFLSQLLAVPTMPPDQAFAPQPGFNDQPATVPDAVAAVPDVAAASGQVSPAAQAAVEWRS